MRAFEYSCLYSELFKNTILDKTATENKVKKA